MWWEKVGNWDEKKKKDVWVREKYWDKKKKGIDMGEREEIIEKTNSTNFPNFPTTQLLTSITLTKFVVK